MRGTLVGVIPAVHVPKVAWHSVVEPTGSKAWLSGVGVVVLEVVVVDEVVVSDDFWAVMRGVELVVLCLDEDIAGGSKVVREIVLLEIAV